MKVDDSESYSGRRKARFFELEPFFISEIDLQFDEIIPDHLETESPWKGPLRSAGEHRRESLLCGIFAASP